MAFSRNVAAACAVLAFGAGAQSALAQASGDGWQGPVAFSGASLDQSLHSMNDYLQARYAEEDMLASLRDPAPERDFETVALAVSDAPALDSIRVDHGFGPAVDGGGSLDLHLASFNADLEGRGEELFVRVARAAGGTALDFAEVAEVPPAPGEPLAFGPEIWNDVTLDAHMLGLFDHMIEHAWRDAVLSVAAAPADTGATFDRYGEALRLY